MTKPTGRPPGKPPHKPTEKTRAIVQHLIGYGAPIKHVAHKIGVSPTTLHKYYQDEIDHGHEEANSLMAESLFKNGRHNNNVTAQIFWMKTRAGWSETSVVKHVGEVNVKVTNDADAFTSRLLSLASRSGEDEGTSKPH